MVSVLRPLSSDYLGYLGAEIKTLDSGGEWHIPNEKFWSHQDAIDRGGLEYGILGSDGRVERVNRLDRGNSFKGDNMRKNLLVIALIIGIIGLIAFLKMNYSRKNS